MLAGLTGFLMSLAGAGLVYFSWRQRKQALAAATGWGLAFLSMLPWSWALGPEIGVTYAFIIFICLVWAEVMMTTEKSRSAQVTTERPLRRLGWPGVNNLFRHGMKFLMSVPACGLIALMLSVALVLNMPWSMPVRFATAIFFYPLLWGGLSAWICAQEKILKPLLVCLGLFAAGGVILII